jgi:hypothetical protein
MFVLRLLVFITDSIVALAAVGGGIALVTGLESNDRIPLEWLKGSPFDSYVIPGLILTVVVGGSAAIAVFAVIDSRTAGGIVSALAGTLLMGYIAVEVVTLNQPSPWTPTEVAFLITGVVMVVAGIVVWRT